MATVTIADGIAEWSDFGQPLVSTFFGVTQRVGGGRIATGSGTSTEQLVCDGAEHLATDRVVADGGLAFKKGDPVAQGTANVCDQLGCTFVPFSGTIRIR